MESDGRKGFEIVINYGFRITLILQFTSYNAFWLLWHSGLRTEHKQLLLLKMKKKKKFFQHLLPFFLLFIIWYVFNSFGFLFSIASCCVFSCNWRFNLAMTKFDSHQRTTNQFTISHCPFSTRIETCSCLFKSAFVSIQIRLRFGAVFFSFSLYPHLSVKSLVFVHFLVIHEINKWKRGMYLRVLCVTCVSIRHIKKKKKEGEKKKHRTPNAATKIHVYFTIYS